VGLFNADSLISMQAIWPLLTACILLRLSLAAWRYLRGKQARHCAVSTMVVLGSGNPAYPPPLPPHTTQPDVSWGVLLTLAAMAASEDDALQAATRRRC